MRAPILASDTIANGRVTLSSAGRPGTILPYYALLLRPWSTKRHRIGVFPETSRRSTGQPLAANGRPRAPGRPRTSRVSLLAQQQFFGPAHPILKLFRDRGLS